MDITSSPFPSLAYSPSYSSSSSAASSASSLFYTAPTTQTPATSSPPIRAPKKVLDVGCGNGSWILNAASIWKETTFVGIDLVAIQPDPFALERLQKAVERQKERMHNAKQMKRSDGSLARSTESGGSGGGGHVSAGRRSFSRFESAPPNLGSDMMRTGERRRPSTANTTSTTATVVASSQPMYQQSQHNHRQGFSLPPSSPYHRIKWIHHNFLTRRLPFKDEEFDFIRVKGIAQGVPEDKVSASILM
jgi:SAM-dependent methyltransferase